MNKEYKKKMSVKIEELQNIIKSQEKMINYYKKQNVELKKENISLKNKLKKLSSSIIENKDDNLIYKYFKDDEEIEKFLKGVVDLVLREEFDVRNITPLYFRKEFNNILNKYLIKELIIYTKEEKIAIQLSSILMNVFYKKIYFFVASFFVFNIDKEIYSDFIYILTTKILVDKNTKYLPIQIEYSVHNMKIIYHKYKKTLSKTKKTFVKIDINKLDEEIFELLQEIEKNEEYVENLTLEENDILVKLTTLGTLEDKKELKKKLKNIDFNKRKVKENIKEIEKKLKKLKDKKMFLQPVNEIVSDNSLKNKEEEIVEKYYNMLYNFAFGLEKALR
jgi:chromosome segregation ATPase